MASCPNCAVLSSQLRDVQLQCDESRAALKTVRDKLADAQRLNVTLQEYSLSVDGFLEVSRADLTKLREEVRQLKLNALEVRIKYEVESSEESANDNNLDDEEVEDGNSDREEEILGHQTPTEEPSSSDYESEVVTKPKKRKTKSKKKRKSTWPRLEKKRKLNEEIWSCECCPYQTQSITHFQFHLREHPDYRHFQCDVEGCGKKFRRMDSMTIHKRLHTGERPYVCQHEGCSKSFDTLKRMKLHNRREHDPDSGVLAIEGPSVSSDATNVAKDSSDCQAVATVSDGLSSEPTTDLAIEGPSTSREVVVSRSVADDDDEQPSGFVKSNRKPIVKPLPKLGSKDYSLNRRGYFKEVDERRGGERFKCDLCDFETNINNRFDKHLECHPSSYRPYRCGIENCKLAFRSEPYRLIHRQLHDGEKKFKCPEKGCDAAFPFRAMFSDHHHELHRPKELFAYHCPYDDCHRRYKRKQELDKHQDYHIRIEKINSSFENSN